MITKKQLEREIKSLKNELNILKKTIHAIITKL